MRVHFVNEGLLLNMKKLNIKPFKNKIIIV